MITAENYKKRKKLETLLREGATIVAFDPTHAGCRGTAENAMVLDWYAGLPLEINDWGIRATEMVANFPYSVYIPWDAINEISAKGS